MRSDPRFRQCARRAAAILVLAACAVVPHWPPRHVDFVYDDDKFVVTNHAVHSISAALRAVGQPFPPSEPARGLYRPLTAISFAADYVAWGGNARGFAITNALLYAAVVFLAWGYFARLLPAPGAAFAAALLFAVHPVHAEAVDAIAGRSELLALALALVSLLLFLRALGCRDARRVPGKGWPAASASAVAYALACGSKESVVLLPALLAVHAWVARPGAGLRSGRDVRLHLLLPHVLAALGYLAVRFHALGALTPARTVLGAEGLAVRAWTAAAVFAEYLRLLLFPAVLQVDAYYLAEIGIARGPSLRGLLGMAAIGAIAFSAWVLMTRSRAGSAPTGPRGRRTGAAALAGISGFVVFLAPVSHAVPLGALMAERLLFAPSLGFLLLAAAAGLALRDRIPRRLPGKDAFITVLVAFLVLAGAWRTRARSLEWRDAVRLWESAAQAVPQDFRVLTNLGAELIGRGDDVRAIRVLEEALVVRPGDARAMFNLAQARRRLGDLEGAAALYGELLRRDPGDERVRDALAQLEAQRGAAFKE